MKSHDESVHVQLLSAFACRVDGAEVFLAEGMRALVIALALANRPVPRSVLAERLWPDLDPEPAGKRLRQTLWRVRRHAGEILWADRGVVGIRREVVVDFRTAEEAAHAILAPGGLPDDLPHDAWELLGQRLLPGERSDEVYFAQQRWDRLRSLALERAATALLERGDIPAAIDVASVAMSVDELGEGPYRLLSKAHAARGDLAAARRVFEGYAELLRTELGMHPSADFQYFPWIGRPSPAVGTGGRRRIGPPVSSATPG